MGRSHFSGLADGEVAFWRGLAVGSFVTLAIGASLIWDARPGAPRARLVPIWSRRALDTDDGARRARRRMVLVGGIGSAIGAALLALSVLHP